MTHFALIREADQPVKLLSLRPDSGRDFVLTSFDGQREWYGIESVTYNDEAIELASQVLQTSNLPAIQAKDSHDQASYEALVSMAIEACREGALEKVVLSRTKAYEALDVKPMDWFKGLQSHYPSATLFMIYREGEALWMGATPECLLDNRGNLLKTMSLAGTRPAGTTGSWGIKEREEQHLVTKDIVNMLQVMGCERIVVDGPVSVKAGPVEHLCSWIEAIFDHAKAPQMASALHPTPAIGGLPRAQALAFVKEHEGYDRSWYSGYFGWKDADRYAFFVNLRCMEVGSDGMRCYAGGGITSRSEPRAEWLETAAKLQTLEHVILH